MYINMLKKQERLTYDINIIKKRLKININDTDLELLYINQINLNKHINNNNILATSDIEDYIRNMINNLITDLNINNRVNIITNEIDIINNIVDNINNEIDTIDNSNVDK